MNFCLQPSGSWDFNSVPSNNLYLKDFLVFFNGEKGVRKKLGEKERENGGKV